MTINYARESVIDFTKPFMNLGISIMFKVIQLFNLNHPKQHTKLLTVADPENFRFFPL